MLGYGRVSCKSKTSPTAIRLTVLISQLHLGSHSNAPSPLQRLWPGVTCDRPPGLRDPGGRGRRQPPLSLESRPPKNLGLVKKWHISSIPYFEGKKLKNPQLLFLHGQAYTMPVVFPNDELFTGLLTIVFPDVMKP